MFYFGWWDFIPIPGFLLALYAQFRLRGLYAKYHDVPQSKGMTGAEVARAILNHAGIRNVAIEPCPGRLTDHYDPSKRVLRLSEENFHTSSLSAIGVAAHEAGHALQHKENYAPMEMRTSIVGVTGFATNMGMILFFVGLFILNNPFVVKLGIWCYSAIVVFQLITLPVEFDASARAKKALAGLGIVEREEGEAIRKVLGAAALTYVAGLATAMLELLRMIMMANSRSRN